MSQKRKVVFSNNSIYHVCNRSIAQEEVFYSVRELRRLLSLIDFYRYPQKYKYSLYKKLSKDARKNYWEEIKKSNPIVEIYTFAIMPTHYHLLLRQKSDKGIPIFISNVQNGYAKYFNKRNERDGGLFKRPFRAAYIPTDELFLQVMRYIHLNQVTSQIVTFEDLKTYPWNSFSIYLQNNYKSFIDRNLVLSYFNGIEKFVSFIANQEDYQKKLYEIKKLLLE